MKITKDVKYIQHLEVSHTLLVFSYIYINIEKGGNTQKHK